MGTPPFDPLTDGLTPFGVGDPVSDTTTVVRLIALIEDARRALGMAEIRIERFPFSVGRERRAAVIRW